MPRYNYTCTNDPKCKVKDVPPEIAEKLIICIGDLDTEEHSLSQAMLMEPKPPAPDSKTQEEKLKESFLVWEEEHGMFAAVDIRCPVCKSPAAKSFSDYYFQGYVRGNGYFDRSGCQRDMNLYKLMKDDPYAMYRKPGEAEDIANKLRAGGKHNPKRVYFGPK
jgi:hypothetical protein